MKLHDWIRRNVNVICNTDARPEVEQAVVALQTLAERGADLASRKDGTRTAALFACIVQLQRVFPGLDFRAKPFTVARYVRLVVVEVLELRRQINAVTCHCEHGDSVGKTGTVSAEEPACLDA